MRGLQAIESVSMAARQCLPSDPDFLLRYIDELPDDADSDFEFEGYLDKDEGPVACTSQDDELQRLPSLDSVEAERDESPLVVASATSHSLPPCAHETMSPSLSPMQGEVASGSPLVLAYLDLLILHFSAHRSSTASLDILFHHHIYIFTFVAVAVRKTCLFVPRTYCDTSTCSEQRKKTTSYKFEDYLRSGKGLYSFPK